MGMKKLLLLFIVSGSLYSQEGRKVAYKIRVVEEFTDKNYKLPDSILFFSGGKGELDYNYKYFFKSLKEKTKKLIGHTDSKFDSSIDFSQSTNSFNEIDYESLSFDQKYVCMFSLGNVVINNRKSTYERKSMMLWSYDFYMILIDYKKDKILLKRKFKVESPDLIYKRNNNLLKAIEKELKTE